uniref:Uncharacterized protein n=1 Tax=Aegilops tauschii TaxID=37682 RepID=M8C295_AEGTA
MSGVLTRAVARSTTSSNQPEGGFYNSLLKCGVVTRPGYLQRGGVHTGWSQLFRVNLGDWFWHFDLGNLLVFNLKWPLDRFSLK